MCLGNDASCSLRKQLHQSSSREVLSLWLHRNFVGVADCKQKFLIPSSRNNIKALKVLEEKVETLLSLHVVFSAVTGSLEAIN